MADAPVPPPLPAAIRITRPYPTEEEFLDKELDTLTRASITLLGAQARPQGVVLRFELVLVSGIVLVRGEGRVVSFKPNAFQGLGGLTLRFTRLDTRSKAFVDRVSAIREQRRPSTRPPANEPAAEPAPPPPAPRAPTLTTTQPGLSAPAPPQESGVVASVSEPSLPGAAPTPLPPAAPAVPAPVRDTLLERLRARAKALDASDVERILAARRRG